MKGIGDLNSIRRKQIAAFESGDLSGLKGKFVLGEPCDNTEHVNNQGNSLRRHYGNHTPCLFCGMQAAEKRKPEATLGGALRVELNHQDQEDLNQGFSLYSRDKEAKNKRSRASQIAQYFETGIPESEDLLHLGKPCIRGHVNKEGFSIRYKSSGKPCVVCLEARTRERAGVESRGHLEKRKESQKHKDQLEADNLFLH